MPLCLQNNIERVKQKWNGKRKTLLNIKRRTLLNNTQMENTTEAKTLNISVSTRFDRWKVQGTTIHDPPIQDMISLCIPRPMARKLRIQKKVAG